MLPVALFKPVEGVHVYEFASVAVKLIEFPIQIAPFGVTFVSGIGLTVTLAFVVLTQPLTSVPVITYACVTVGLATTVLPVVELKAVAGDHTYVLAPATFKLVLLPIQILCDVGSAINVGFGFTVITTFVIGPTQPFKVGVIAYVTVPPVVEAIV